MRQIIKTTFYSIKSLKTGMYLTFDLKETCNINEMYTPTNLPDLHNFINASGLHGNNDYSVVTWNLEWAV